MRSIAINTCVSEIMNVRDMCGDELLVVREVQSDFKIKFTDSELREIRSKVGGKWKDCQVAAGSKILSNADRVSAWNALTEND